VVGSAGDDLGEGVAVLVGMLGQHPGEVAFQGVGGLGAGEVDVEGAQELVQRRHRLARRERYSFCRLHTSIIRPSTSSNKAVLTRGIPWNWRRTMNVLVRVRCIAVKQVRRRGTLIKAALALAFFLGGPSGFGLRAGQCTSDAITRVGILVGPAPTFHPLRGWV